MIGAGQGSAEFQSETIKCHITSAITTITTNTWTDFSGFEKIESESLGDFLSLNVDEKTIDVEKSGLYQFGGCVHYLNQTAGIFSSLTILSRVYVNGEDEARCSQRGQVINFAAGGEDILSYCGTVFLNKGDTLTLQYFCSNSDVDFFSNSNFANPVACTIWLIYSGEK